MLEATTWNKLETERLSDKITRQMLWGEKIMIARIFLARGAQVPRHSHANEQLTMVESGALKLVFDDHAVLLRDGQMLLIPGHVPHAAVALEDTWDVDVFSPPRQDWISKNDAYLRK